VAQSDQQRLNWPAFDEIERVSPPTVEFRNVDLDVMRALAVVLMVINHVAGSRPHPCSESRETLPLPQHRWHEVLTTAMSSR